MSAADSFQPSDESYPPISIPASTQTYGTAISMHTFSLLCAANFTVEFYDRSDYTNAEKS